MTEQEAALRLADLLNEIEGAGIQVETGDDRLYVGLIPIAAPPCEDEPWEVLLP